MLRVPSCRLHSSILSAAQFHPVRHTVPSCPLHSSNLSAAQFHPVRCTVPSCPLHCSILSAAQFHPVRCTVPSCLLHSSILSAAPPHSGCLLLTVAPAAAQHLAVHIIRSPRNCVQSVRLNRCVTYVHCRIELPCLTLSPLCHNTCCTLHVNVVLSHTYCQLNISVSLQVSLVPDSASYCLLP
jgi:hypothetical protein